MPDPAAPAAPPVPGLRPRDAAACAAWPDLLSVHPYQAAWFHNATFVFPLLGALGAGVAWAVTASAELGGIALFFLAVTALMLPIVFLTWQRTATAVVLRRAGLAALHQGHVLRAFTWDEVSGVRRVETMGNLRWYIDAATGEHLTLDGEIADLSALLQTARRLARLPNDPPPPTHVPPPGAASAP